jgi:putative endonuclease
VTGRLLQLALRALDHVSRRLPWTRPVPEHLRTGRRGEDDAYFWLRRQGYTMVARNWRSPHRRGEIDLIGWNKGVLCFIEVKTRSERGLAPAEMAVDLDKQRELRAVAGEYLRRLRRTPYHRFDVISVYYGQSHGPDLNLLKNAFPGSSSFREAR